MFISTSSCDLTSWACPAGSEDFGPKVPSEFNYHLNYPRKHSNESYKFLFIPS